MATDYRKLCIELFGTDDVNTLKKIAEKPKPGRKKKFSDKEADRILKLYSGGMTIKQIAEKYGTSRQIISKYINMPVHKGCSMRMTYMYKKSPCTEIDIDFLEK
ncbi:MAG: Hin recombinase, partial [Oscillospiraceae bacterium]|nr:Hin recombinase [Oscillospiraceae bacterium]